MYTGHIDTTAVYWASNMIQACWQGALLVLVVGGICRLFKHLPASTRCALWWLASMKFLIGLVWMAPITLALLPPSALQSEAPEIRVALVRRAAMPGREATTLPAISAAYPVTAVGPSVPDAPRVRTSAVSPITVILCLWLTGVALCLAAITRQILHIRQLLRLATSTDLADLDHDAGKIARSLGMKKTPRIMVSDAFSSGPLVIGPLRPVILLAKTDLARLSRTELHGVLAHEMAHIRRRDLWLGIVPVMARILFFFDPFIWLACREYELAQEAACDAEALHVTDTRADVYGRLLLKLGTTDYRSNRALALGVTADYRLLRRRLQSLESLPRVSQRRFYLSLLLVASLAAVNLVPVRVIARQNKVDRALHNAVTARRGVDSNTHISDSGTPRNNADSTQRKKDNMQGMNDSSGRDGFDTRNNADLQTGHDAQSDFVRAPRDAMTTRPEATEARAAVPASRDAMHVKHNAAAAPRDAVPAQRDAMVMQQAAMAEQRGAVTVWGEAAASTDSVVSADSIVPPIEAKTQRVIAIERRTTVVAPIKPVATRVIAYPAGLSNTVYQRDSPIDKTH